MKFNKKKYIFVAIVRTNRAWKLLTERLSYQQLRQCLSVFVGVLGNYCLFRCQLIRYIWGK